VTTFYEAIIFDELVKTQNWDGKVKSESGSSGFCVLMGLKG